MDNSINAQHTFLLLPIKSTNFQFVVKSLLLRPIEIVKNPSERLLVKNKRGPNKSCESFIISNPGKVI